MEPNEIQDLPAAIQPNPSDVEDVFDDTQRVFSLMEDVEDGVADLKESLIRDCEILEQYKHSNASKKNECTELTAKLEAAEETKNMLRERSKEFRGKAQSILGTTQELNMELRLRNSECEEAERIFIENEEQFQSLKITLESKEQELMAQKVEKTKKEMEERELLKTLQEENFNLKIKLAKVDNELIASEKRLKEQQQLQSLKEFEQEEDIVKLKSLIKSVDAEILIKSQDLEIAKTEAANKASSIKAEIAELDRKIEEEEAHVQEDAKKVDASAKKLEEISEEIITLENYIKDQLEKNVNTERQIKETNSKLKAIQECSESKVDALKVSISTHQETLRVQNELNAKLTQDIEAITKKIKYETEQIEELTGQLAKNVKLDQNLPAVIEKLETELMEVKERTRVVKAKYAKDLVEYNVKVNLENQTCEDIHSKNNKLKEEIDKIQRLISEKKTHYTKIEKQHKETSQLLQEVNSKINAIKAEMKTEENKTKATKKMKTVKKMESPKKPSHNWDSDSSMEAEDRPWTLKTGKNTKGGNPKKS